MNTKPSPNQRITITGSDHPSPSGRGWDKNQFSVFYSWVRVLFFVLILGMAANAAVVGSTDDAMTIGGGARPIGMGRAFTAIVDDADAAFINPAGLAGLKGPSAMSMFTNLLGEVYYMEYSGVYPTPYGAFGAGYISTGVNNIPTAVNGVPTVPTDYYDSLVTLTYSAALGTFFRYGRNVYAGVNYKIFNRGYTGGLSQYATGNSADIGLKVVVTPNLSLGICRQNFLPVSMGGVLKLSGSAAEESLASLTKVGIAVKPAFLQKILVAADADLPAQTGRPVTFHFGAEWKPFEIIAIRAGLDQSVDPISTNKASWNPSYGTSFLYAGFRVDYAFHPYYNDPSLATTYVSLSYTGEPWFALKGRAE